MFLSQISYGNFYFKHVQIRQLVAFLFPSGLQLGFFLERAGRDYVIFERDSLAGKDEKISKVFKNLTLSLV